MGYEYFLTDALKWTVLIFAAGFIGFFGKYLGKIVLTLFHRERGPEGPGAGPPSPSSSSGASSPEDGKLLKKAEKARVKAQKKLAKQASMEEKE